MARPEQVAAAVDAMKAAVSIPVTVKHRIGIDDLDRYEDMLNFVDVVSSAVPSSRCTRVRPGCKVCRPNKTETSRHCATQRFTGSSERADLLIEINGGICAEQSASTCLASS